MVDQKDFFAASAGEMLRSLGNEGIENVRKVILKSANRAKDDAVLQWLEVIAEADPEPSFQDWIMSLFWDLPRDRKDHAILPKSKEWILSKVIEDWKPEQSSASARVFLFLLAAYEPTENRLKACGVSESVWRSFGQFWESSSWTWGTRETILELIRRHTDSRFTPLAIEKWLAEPDIPSEIAEVMLHAWARNGGWFLMQRHLLNKKILLPFQPEDRSQAACRFLENLGQAVAALENDIARLFATIPGKLQEGAKYQYDRLDQISLSFCLAERQSPEEEARLCDQARTAIERWIEWQKARGNKVSVFLRFDGELASAFRKEEWMLSK